MGSLKGIFESAIDLLPDLTPGFDVPGVPFLAQGGIIPGTQLGVPVIVAEGGRAEAVIPITRPARALAVMQEAGLDKLVLNAYMGGTIASGKAVAGDTTMLHIDHAVMTAPVDADMIVQKVTAAYNRLAS